MPQLAQAKYAMTAFKFKGRYEILAIAVHFLQITQDLVISRCWFASDGLEMYKDSKSTFGTICFAYLTFCGLLNILITRLIHSQSLSLSEIVQHLVLLSFDFSQKGQ